MNKNKIPRVLVIAGSDSSGGAGIQADIKTLTVFKVFSMTAITAITAQNTNGVSSVESVSLDLINKQIEDCISDIGVDAIKIISLLKKSGKKASEFLRPFSITPYKIKNLKKIDNNILDDKSIKNSLKKIQFDLKNKHNGRLLVRPSGTEPIVRILVECEYNDKIDQYITKVQNLLTKENSSE